MVDRAIVELLASIGITIKLSDITIDKVTLEVRFPHPGPVPDWWL